MVLLVLLKFYMLIMSMCGCSVVVKLISRRLLAPPILSTARKATQINSLRTGLQSGGKFNR